MININFYEKQFEHALTNNNLLADSSHDLSHIKRVLNTASKIGKIENANFEILIPATWLHDFYIVPKNSVDRNKASLICAEKAIDFFPFK